jgi:Protein of unknown function (DUF2490)
LLSGTAVGAAQKSVTHQTLYWVRYYNQMSLNQHWTWHNEIDNRRFLSPHRHHHIIWHSRLHYRLSNMSDAALGLTYSRQSPHDPQAIQRLVVPEWRPVAEANLLNPLSEHLALQHRWRTDARFVRRNNGLALQEGYRFNWRFRYRLQLSYSFNVFHGKHAFHLKLANELMVNAGPDIVYNHFDQNRMYIGLEYHLYPSWHIETGYLYWYQQRAAGDQFFDRDIVRVTLLHRVKL